MSVVDYVVPGIRLGVAAAGIKYADRDDMVVIELADSATCAAVFTCNAFCAAPVQLARSHLQQKNPRYLLINSGNANAGTGQQGLQDALISCQALAGAVGCDVQQVLPFSTGVIDENLPVERLREAMPVALNVCISKGWDAASRAIMTTDNHPKLVSRHFEFDGVAVHVTGMAKGSGMIRSDMATMLAYLATDLAVTPELLQSCLNNAVKPSFNSITVDGDTSTNDACVLIASGVSSLSLVTEADSVLYKAFSQAIMELCLELSREIVRDGEGATKLVDILVENAASEAETRDVAYTIAHSLLVKRALFASDPNWGRILAAVGRAGLDALMIDQVEIWLNDVCIVCHGERASEYTEQAGESVMNQPAFTIRVNLGRDGELARVVTCDLSYDYVKINAEYRT
ncbi:MAG: bifunctional glutamate N-acetyltransferase/amino-acid acetyltransferase ArgJ [Candidatus Thiodiazotropha sp. (ex Lucinoma aequizonata)]|nr:bifunctional glutamate N-acetyltransferase/amino-acid acetyltransferase ArgJ [Candidatus Thiodiazotropha sp. (ex Lucinoma aequizonata)]MCU7886854.1 bifunctional glutamate N-acetyltransferase/amino-acid acetyltransferase ArgJ [Candidatus Thiodiazotropha sp. (ex Lucinoma aequizonata)]MCU7896122.1 bifunctional glutamate N-acetyltransferase/amino-acid acetyltransferase ArgJ [Candidatus Thiodiazotropha sp. (ex Lucinoma aequizonata)]MCU7900285.1 bifunctional glutamate N-acetyltransferase/amino-acid